MKFIASLSAAAALVLLADITQKGRTTAVVDFEFHSATNTILHPSGIQTIRITTLTRLDIINYTVAGEAVRITNGPVLVREEKVRLPIPGKPPEIVPDIPRQNQTLRK